MDKLEKQRRLETIFIIIAVAAVTFFTFALTYIFFKLFS